LCFIRIRLWDRLGQSLFDSALDTTLVKTKGLRRIGLRQMLSYDADLREALENPMGTSEGGKCLQNCPMLKLGGWFAHVDQSLNVRCPVLFKGRVLWKVIRFNPVGRAPRLSTGHFIRKGREDIGKQVHPLSITI
jgi:hypothetical protein